MTLEVKIFIVALMLQELLDETEGNSKFKYKIKWHIKELNKLLENITDHELKDNNVSKLITSGIGRLEEYLEQEQLTI